MRNGTLSYSLAFVVLAVLIAATLPGQALAENVLILSQGSFFTVAMQDNNRLQSVLQAYGHNVTIGGPYATFDGMELQGQNVVILPQFDLPDMPINGQQALVDFVSKGGGLIANAWTVWKWAAQDLDYFVWQRGLERLGSLLPVQHINGRGYTFETEALTLTQATPPPVLMSAIPSTFSFWVGTWNNEAGTEALLLPQLTATVFYDSEGSSLSTETKTAALVGWRFGKGHVLQLSTTFTNELADATFGRLVANAVTWAGRANLGPLVTELRFDRDAVGTGESLAASFLGEGLSSDTYFDVRFRAPGSTTNEVAVNWQQGTSVRHTIPSDIAIGSWTVTGVRAHQDKDEHTGEFDPVSGFLTVNTTVLPSDPFVESMSFDPASTRPGGSFSAKFSGANLFDETYFDVRVQIPGSNLDEVVLNWQRGMAAVHFVPPNLTPGIWKVTGVRAHVDPSDHTAAFTSISAAVTVSSLILSDLQLDRGSVETEGLFTAIVSGKNLTPETYFDVRFRAPCSDKDEVALNWQRGASETHRSPVGLATGVWTISGVWAHQDMNDHSTDFAPVSANLLVYQPNAIPFSGKVTSIAVDPSRSANIYTATTGSGVYKTCDGGQTWIAAAAGLPNDVVTLALDPASPRIVYAGTSIGVFKSIDSGVNWNTASAGLPNAAIRALAVDPRRPATIYAATEGNGVFKSLDGGIGWSAASTGLPAAATVQSLAIDAVSSDIVYAGTDVAYANRAAVFRSSDGGDHWEESWLPASSAIVAQTIYALLVDPSNPAVVYAGTLNPDIRTYNQAGAFKSRDGGRTWAGLQGLWGPDHRGIRSMAIDPIYTSNLYAASINGVFWKSTDEGSRWTASPGWKNPTIAVDPGKPSTIYIGDGKGQGIFKSTDAGVTWQKLDVR